MQNLKYNLISISQLCDNDYSVVFDKNVCLVNDKLENIIMKDNMCINTYKIIWNTQPVKSVCFIAKNLSQCTQVEMFLGKAHQRSLVELKHKDVILNFSVQPENYHILAIILRFCRTVFDVMVSASNF